MFLTVVFHRIVIEYRSSISAGEPRIHPVQRHVSASMFEQTTSHQPTSQVSLLREATTHVDQSKNSVECPQYNVSRNNDQYSFYEYIYRSSYFLMY